MLIDTSDRRPDREPEPEPERRRWTFDPRVLGPFVPFAEAIALLVLIDFVPPLPGYVMLVSSCWLICHGLSTMFAMDRDGLNEHRQ